MVPDDQFRREVERIMQGSMAELVRDMQDIAADIDALAREAESGNHERLADLLRAALEEALKETKGPYAGHMASPNSGT
jgi:DNA-binding protein YbaB